MYIRQDGRIKKLVFISSSYGTRDHWIDVGPALPLRRFDRALLVMQQLERTNRTSTPRYALARAIAISEMGHAT